MYYLERTPLYDTEKPYSMRYQPDDGIPQTNFVKTECPITVKSMREPGAGPFRLNECGFQQIELHSQMSYDDFWDNEAVQRVYIQEVKDVLKRELGAKHVFVLDYAVRKRHETFPVSTGEEYDFDQPIALAHIGKVDSTVSVRGIMALIRKIDFTVEEGERIIKVLFGERADEVLKGRWQAIK